MSWWNCVMVRLCHCKIVSWWDCVMVGLCHGGIVSLLIVVTFDCVSHLVVCQL